MTTFIRFRAVKKQLNCIALITKQLLIISIIIYILSMLSKVLPVVFWKHIKSDYKNVCGKVWPIMTILRGKKKKLTLPEIDLLWSFGNQDKLTKQNRIKNLEINPYIYRNVIYDVISLQITGEKWIVQEMVFEKSSSLCEKIISHSYLTENTCAHANIYSHNNFKCIHYLNVKSISLDVLEKIYRKRILCLQVIEIFLNLYFCPLNIQ